MSVTKKQFSTGEGSNIPPFILYEEGTHKTSKVLGHNFSVETQKSDFFNMKKKSSNSRNLRITIFAVAVIASMILTGVFSGGSIPGIITMGSILAGGVAIGKVKWKAWKSYSWKEFIIDLVAYSALAMIPFGFKLHALYAAGHTISSTALAIISTTASDTVIIPSTLFGLDRYFKEKGNSKGSIKSRNNPNRRPRHPVGHSESKKKRKHKSGSSSLGQNQKSKSKRRRFSPRASSSRNAASTALP